MADEPNNLVALERARTLARERIGEGYARDLIDADELDRRLELLERAATATEIELLARDLVAPTVVEPTQLVRVAAQPHELAPTQTIGAWFSETKRTGPWTPARENAVTAVLASVRLDLREARLAEGTTAFVVKVVAGEIEIIVPPGLRIDLECSAFFGEVDHDEPVEPVEPAPEHAHVRVLVTGSIYFGSVSVREQLPGETRSEARKRRKAARKRLVAANREKRKQLGPAR